MPCANRPYDMRYHRCCRSFLCPCCKLMASAPMPGRGKRPNLEPIGTRTLNIQSVKAWVPEAWQPHILRLDVGGCWRHISWPSMCCCLRVNVSTYSTSHEIACRPWRVSTAFFLHHMQLGRSWPYTGAQLTQLTLWKCEGHLATQNKRGLRIHHSCPTWQWHYRMRILHGELRVPSIKMNIYVEMTWKLPALGAGNLDEDKAHGWDILRLKLQDQGILETKHQNGPTMNRRPTWLQFSSHDNRKHRYSKHGVIVSVRLAILQYVLAWKLQGLEAPKDRLSDYWWLLVVIIVHHSTHCCQWRRRSCFGKISLSGQKDCAD